MSFKKWLPLWIVLFGIAIRLLTLVLFPRIGEGERLDSVRYKRVAVSLIEGRGFAEYGRRPTAFTPPVYPFFLAGIFKIFGYHDIAVKIIQTIIGGLLCLVIYRIGLLLFNARVAALAASVVAVFPDLVILTGYLYTETLYIFINTSAFFFILKLFSNRGRTKDAIWGGFVLGFSILTRHNLLLFPVFLLLLMAVLKYQKIKLKNLLVLTLICYLVITPWNIRNYICFKKFIPVTVGIGGPLWIGSYIPYNGEYRYSESDKKIDEEVGGVNDITDKDTNLIIKAFKNIMDNPLAYSKIVIKKFFNYFLQIYENVPKGSPRHANVFITLILGLSYYPVFFLFLAGIIISIKRWKELLPLYTLIFYSGVVYSMTVIVPRYRIPLIPFFIILAVYAMTVWIDRLNIKISAKT